MENLKSYIQSNSQRFLDELFGLIRIPSISSQSEHKEDMVKTAQYIVDQLEVYAAKNAARLKPSNPLRSMAKTNRKFY